MKSVMAIEIEHKYLVIGSTYRDMAETVRVIRQGYLSRDIQRTVRIRTVNDKGFITIKGESSSDSRSEYEYQIPLKDAEELLKMCLPGIISKKRYIVPFKGFVWEVDEFGGEHQGLVMAEIELPGSDTQYALPPFVGKNVTGDPDYYNSALSNQASKNTL